MVELPLAATKTTPSDATATAPLRGFGAASGAPPGHSTFALGAGDTGGVGAEDTGGEAGLDATAPSHHSSFTLSNAPRVPASAPPAADERMALERLHGWHPSGTAVVSVLGALLGILLLLCCWCTRGWRRNGAASKRFK